MLIESSLNSFTLNPRLMRTGLQTIVLPSVQCPVPTLPVSPHLLPLSPVSGAKIPHSAVPVTTGHTLATCLNLETILTSSIQPPDPLQTRADGAGPGSHTYSLVVLCVLGKMLLIPESRRVLGSGGQSQQCSVLARVPL